MRTTAARTAAMKVTMAVAVMVVMVAAEQRVAMALVVAEASGAVGPKAAGLVVAV